MNKNLQNKLSSLEALISTQKDCVSGAGAASDYMHGMANGMILAHSIFSDSSPQFVIRPRRSKKCKVRHKTAKFKGDK